MLRLVLLVALAIAGAARALMARALMEWPRCLLALLASAAPVMAQDQSARKHGLWETTTTFEGSGAPAQTFRHCTDEDADALITRMNQLTVGAGQEKCPQPEVQRSGNTTTVSSTCKIGPSTITSRGVITTGDGAYTIKFTSKWEGGPPIPGMPAAGTSNMTIDGKRLGDCKPEQ